MPPISAILPQNMSPERLDSKSTPNRKSIKMVHGCVFFVLLVLFDAIWTIDHIRYPHGHRGCACVQSSHVTLLNISWSAGSIPLNYIKRILTLAHVTFRGGGSCLILGAFAFISVNFWPIFKILFYLESLWKLQLGKYGRTHRTHFRRPWHWNVRGHAAAATKDGTKIDLSSPYSFDKYIHSTVKQSLQFDTIYLLYTHKYYACDLTAIRNICQTHCNQHSIHYC